MWFNVNFRYSIRGCLRTSPKTQTNGRRVLVLALRVSNERKTEVEGMIRGPHLDVDNEHFIDIEPLVIVTIV